MGSAGSARWPAAAGLSGLCTLLPFALALVALRHLSAYTVQLVTNLEPVYAIVLAMLFLAEQHELSAQFYLGVTIILGGVFLHPLLNRLRPAATAS
ncbi:EamA family transporter [Stenotrophomonas pictorum]|uniref:EamA family transporter n=1 Tax=Stenotrophomonas pictorum TaxID=86184 RepID=UPI0031B5A658